MFILRFFIFLSIVGSVVNFLPSRWCWQEVNLNLGSYYLVAHVLSLPLLILWPRPFQPVRGLLLSLIVAGISAFYLSVVWPFYVDQPNSMASEPGIKVFYANVHTANIHKLETKELISKENPDIVALLEFDQGWYDGLDLDLKYPFHSYILRGDNFGIGLYSKLPFVGEVTNSIGDNLPPIIRTKIQLSAERVVELILFHAIPPLTQANHEANELIVRRITAALRDYSGDAIVMGDLNATPFSGRYGRLDWGASLKNAMHGFGLLRTYNAEVPFIRLTIDHMLYRGGLTVRDFKVGPDIGSDHYPLIAVFGLS